MSAPYVPLPIVAPKPDPRPVSGSLFEASGVRLTLDDWGFMLQSVGTVRLTAADVRRLAEAILTAIPEETDE